MIDFFINIPKRGHQEISSVYETWGPLGSTLKTDKANIV